MRERLLFIAMRYLITFACYGAHMHGDDTGSVDPRHHVPGTPVLQSDSRRLTAERRQVKSEPYVLNDENRPVVLGAIKQVCAHRGWVLLAAQVRQNHVHIVVEGDEPPERMLNDLKSYASRSLNCGGESARPRWARHGSTRWLWNDASVRKAIGYVVEDQGEPMAVFIGAAL